MKSNLGKIDNVNKKITNIASIKNLPVGTFIRRIYTEKRDKETGEYLFGSVDKITRKDTTGFYLGDSFVGYPTQSEVKFLDSDSFYLGFDKKDTNSGIFEIYGGYQVLGTNEEDIKNLKEENYFKSFNASDISAMLNLSSGSKLKQICLKNGDNYLFDKELNEIGKIKGGGLNIEKGISNSHNILVTNIKPTSESDDAIRRSVIQFNLENGLIVLTDGITDIEFQNLKEFDFVYNKDMKGNLLKITYENGTTKYFGLSNELSKYSLVGIDNVNEESLTTEKTNEEYEKEYENKWKQEEINEKKSKILNGVKIEGVSSKGSNDVDNLLLQTGFEKIDDNTYISDRDKNDIFIECEIRENKENSNISDVYIGINKRKHLDISQEREDEMNVMYDKIKDSILSLMQQNTESIQELKLQDKGYLLRKYIHEGKKEFELTYDDESKEKLRMFISSSGNLCYFPKGARNKGYEFRKSKIDTIKEIKIIK